MSKIKYGPHGCFSDSTSQQIVSTTVAQAVALNTDEDKYRITHSTTVNNSRVYLDVAGAYFIYFSAVADLVSGTNHLLNIWLSVNGTNVPRSNTIINLVGTNEQIVTAAFMYQFNAGDYFELMMSGSNTNVRLLATGAQTGPVRPACPSMIITVHKVST